MAKILNIEIGNLITRVAEMDFKVKNPKVYHYFSFPTPEGVVEDGFVHENPEFIAAMKGALHEHKVKTRSAVFVVTSSKIVTREVAIPSIKLNQLGTFIKANANDYFPIDLTMYEISHVLLGTDASEDGKEKFRVLVMAAGKDLISGYADLAGKCGLKLHSIEYIGNSLYQLMKSECTDVPTLVVRVEESVTVASILVNGNMALQRTLAYGVERAIKAVMDSSEYYESDYTSAFKLLCQRPCLKVALNDRTRIIESDDAPYESDRMEEARSKVTITFTQLISNLVRVIELYNSKDPINSVKKVVLIGMGSEVVNLTKLFRNEIGIETVALKQFKSVAVLEKGGEGEGRYAGVFGAGLNPVGLMAEGKKKEKKQVNYGLCTVLALVLVIIVLAYLFLSAFLPNLEEQKEEERLKGLEQQYAEAEIVHKQYLAIETLYNDVDARSALMEHPNDSVLQFFAELEEKLPADTNLTAITSGNADANLIVHVADYEEAAKVLQILRTFESLRDVKIAGIAATDSEETGFDLAITCTYYPMGEITE